MKHIFHFLFSFFCFFAFNSSAQPDSLIRAAEKVPKDTTGFYTLYNLGKAYVKVGKNGDALKTFNKAYNLAKEIHFDYGQAMSLQITGNCYMAMDNDSVASDYYMQSLVIAKKIKRLTLIAANMSQLAIISASRSDFSGALSTYKKALTLATMAHDSSIMVGVMVNMANLYSRMEDPEKAMILLQDVLKISKRLKNDRYTGHIAGNLGNIFSDKGDFDEAKAYFNQSRAWAKKNNDLYIEAIATSNLAGIEKDRGKAIDLYNTSLTMFDSLHNQFEVARVTHNIGVALLNGKQYKAALAYLEKASLFFNKVQDYYGLSLVYSQMAKAYMNLGEIKKANSFAQQAIQEAKQSRSIKQEQEGYHLLYEIHKKTGDNKNALAYLEKTLLLKDSLNFQKKNNALNVLKTKLELEKQEELLTARAQSERQKLLAKAEKEQVELEARQTRQIILSLVFLLILIIVSVFSFFLWKRFKTIESQKELIEKQKELVEEKQKEILDSIHYAKRIQKALLPPEQYVERNLTKWKK